MFQIVGDVDTAYILRALAGSIDMENTEALREVVQEWIGKSVGELRRKLGMKNAD